MGRTKGSTDGKPRDRRTKSDDDKKNDAEARNQRKAREEAAQKQRNGANFRASMFGHRCPPDVGVPPHPKPTIDNDAVAC